MTGNTMKSMVTCTQTSLVKKELLTWEAWEFYWYPLLCSTFHHSKHGIKTGIIHWRIRAWETWAVNNSDMTWCRMHSIFCFLISANLSSVKPHSLIFKAYSVPIPILHRTFKFVVCRITAILIQMSMSLGGVAQGYFSEGPEWELLGQSLRPVIPRDIHNYSIIVFVL